MGVLPTSICIQSFQNISCDACETMLLIAIEACISPCLPFAMQRSSRRLWFASCCVHCVPHGFPISLCVLCSCSRRVGADRERVTEPFCGGCRNAGHVCGVSFRCSRADSSPWCVWARDRSLPQLAGGIKGSLARYLNRYRSLARCVVLIPAASHSCRPAFCNVPCVAALFEVRALTLLFRLARAVPVHLVLRSCIRFTLSFAVNLVCSAPMRLPIAVSLRRCTAATP